MPGIGIGVGLAAGKQNALPDLTGASSFARGQAPGTFIASLPGIPADATVGIAPDDGRVQLYGDYNTGFGLCFGWATHAVGTLSVTITVTSGPASRVSVHRLTITAGSAVPPWVFTDTANLSGIDQHQIDFDIARSWDATAQVESDLSAVIDMAASTLNAGYAVTNAGKLKWFAAGQLRQTDKGLFFEAATVSNLLSHPFMPAAQSVTLAAGTYTLSCWADGPAGTVTITGAQMKRSVYPVAQFNGGLSGTTMTVTANTGTTNTPALCRGMIVAGNGISASSNVTITDASGYSIDTRNGTVTLSQSVTTAVSAAMTASDVLCGSVQARQNQHVTFTVLTAGTYSVAVTGPVTAMQLETGTHPHMPWDSGANGTRPADILVPAGKLASLMADINTPTTFEMVIENFGPWYSGTTAYLMAGSTQGGEGVRRDTGQWQVKHLNATNDISTYPYEQAQRIVITSDSTGYGLCIQHTAGGGGSTFFNSTEKRPVLDRIGYCPSLPQYGGSGILKQIRYYARRWTSSDTVFTATDTTEDNPTAINGFLRGFSGQTVRFDSSIDPEIWSSQAGAAGPMAGRLSWNPRRGRRPLIVLLHGTNGHYAEMRHDTVQRWLCRGFAVYEHGGRNNAYTTASNYVSGPTADANGNTADSSNREIHDIIDAVQYLRGAFGYAIDFGQVNFVGYSGGAGNAIALTMKAPELGNGICAAWPITAFDVHWGYVTGPTGIALSGGSINLGNRATGIYAGKVRPHASEDDPATGTNAAKYYSRNAVAGSPVNARGAGHVFFCGDAADVQVKVQNPDDLAAAYAAAGLSNYDYVRGDTSDPDVTHSYLHGTPSFTNTSAKWEDVFKHHLAAGKYRKAVLPRKGAGYRIHGWLWSWRFAIFLGDKVAGLAGIGGSNAATATLDAYDLVAGTFVLTPVLPASGVPYKIICNGTTVTGTLNGPTTIQLP